jgi:hypothetical protein
MLSQVPNSFTEDDIELLEKIAAGKVWVTKVWLDM